MIPLICPLCGGRLEFTSSDVLFKCFACGTHCFLGDEKVKVIAQQRKDRGGSYEKHCRGMTTHELRLLYQKGIITRDQLWQALVDKGFASFEAGVLARMAERR